MFSRFKLPKIEFGSGKDPRVLVRAVLGALLLANVAAALILLKPWGGSPEDLAQRLESLRKQVQQKQMVLQRSKSVLAKAETAHNQGDSFLKSYFAERRGAYYKLVGELVRTARQSGIKPKEHSFGEEPVEGSDNMEMVTVTGNYEGNYGDLLRFISALDRSPRFIILEQLNASPQQGSGLLTVNIKMHAFVRDTGAGAPTGPPTEEEVKEEQARAEAEAAAPPAPSPQPPPPAVKPASAPVPAARPQQLPPPNIMRSAPPRRDEH